VHSRWDPRWACICNHLAIQRYCIYYSSGLLTQHSESNVCWVTQLVVSSERRERGIATTLLHLLPGPDVKCTAFGLASSHPAACAALSKRARMFRLVCILFVCSLFWSNAVPHQTRTSASWTLTLSRPTLR